MTADERACLEALDAVVRSNELGAKIKPVVDRVCAALAQKPEVVMTWEPIPLEIFRQKLPPEIRSGWVFVLRAGADTGAERHPNSHQRMMTLHGTGDMRTESTKEDLGIKKEELRIKKDEKGELRIKSPRRLRPSAKKEEKGIDWQPNVLVSEPSASLERRWISIPPNVWHRPVVGKDADWVVISFHTVPAEELIEEKLDEAGGEMTRKKYVQK